MYPKYFGLKEPSFSIAPDPQYLYLSEQHREALAHLLYGAGEGGGFVLLTGEVGTGKTTVCRAFLEQLPDGVDVALILNSAQSANELLCSICDEFRVSLPSGQLSNKVLVDRLNQYLLEAHGRGHRPVLIIDEAQNLRPQVMEQIRLLTNLETTKQKLLQIFLIGQPELRRMLESDRLRQLNQRITARFHLNPFSLKETGDYIRHRVAVGGVDRPLFTAGAIRLIYRHSGGIPRLINILCDRALLGACVTRSSQVTPSITAKAAREVHGASDAKPSLSVGRLAMLASISFVLALGIGLGTFYLTNGDPEHTLAWIERELGWPGVASSDSIAVEEVPAVETPSAAGGGDSAAPESSSASETAVEADVGVPGAPVATEPPEIPLADFAPDQLDATLDRLSLSESWAMLLLLKRWGIELNDLGAGEPCARAMRFGLSCQRETGTLSNVRFFDLPALMRLNGSGAGERFLVLTALGAREAVVELPDGPRRIPVEGLERIWSGDYILLWQTPPGGTTVISSASPGDDVRWLRELLAQVPGIEVPDRESSRYDASLLAALKAFQSSKGLQPDGLAGPRTLIQLHHAVEMPGVPRLDRIDASGAVEVP
ncbi:Peptidoglycan-binding domain 1 protein [Thiorhodococcus drewsii AZ1]|uniref:Peptidoglycan-binding domain 1 protein n=1 Tax=Thiorhodococcus drewsii AZ1 TaxID=765913 RepID=G2E654_9GAMM|nr:AAA family ATPase [Thiorhodococcus drewsii]EGV28471.1 Peptidoglycan-binding domain 1 protein [Thiorhodococcus drewsii AZ1]